MHTRFSLIKPKHDCRCLLTLNNLETRHSSYPDPQLPNAEEPWDSKALSPEVPQQAASVEEIAEVSVADLEVSEVVIVVVSVADLVDSVEEIAEVSAVVIVEVSEADLVVDSAASEPQIN